MMLSRSDFGELSVDGRAVFCATAIWSTVAMGYAPACAIVNIVVCVVLTFLSCFCVERLLCFLAGGYNHACCS